MVQKSLCAAICALMLGVVDVAGAKVLEPFSYPSTLLDTPATLTQPPALFARLGKPMFELDVTPFVEAANFLHATRYREGHGDFERDFFCVAGTENDQPILGWVIASGTSTVSEIQLTRVRDASQIPPYCAKLTEQQLPVRLGPVGIGMSIHTVDELLGPASHVDTNGWHFWFSQRFLRNQRGLQELELNWLGLHFTNSHVDQAFISLVKNP